ncbi:uncharacterized protein LODBEIA_P04340 [Lodderomyces beijingensis]|uniref:Protein YTP1-like C-terminal domain-containing protein n=1 Tax=Lodderomyces beijingensis TaxID=1775926 RepID=A0ABP0ZIP6_9ASCO
MKFSGILLLLTATTTTTVSAMVMDSEPMDSSVAPHAYTHSHNHNQDQDQDHASASASASVSGDDYDSNGSSTSETRKLVPIPHVSKHQHGLPILQTHLLPEEKLFWENYNTTTYFTVASNHRPALYIHIIVGLFSIFVLYPVCLIFNNLNMTKTYLASLLVYSAFMVLSLLNYSIFINSIPNIYPGNAYNKMIIILFVTTCLQLLLAVLKKPKIDNSCNSTFQASDSGSSGGSYFSLRPSSSGEDVSESSSIDSSTPVDIEKMIKPESPIYRFKKNWILHVSKFRNFFNIAFNLLNWGHFFYFFALIPTAIATFCLYGQGITVFNLLAHFIKGGVFFAYGVLSLARYCGGFANKGWSWNHKFVEGNSPKLNYWQRFQNKGLWTMEMIESSLILFYGSTNIFLEHLSNAGKEWSAKDLQHVSIAFIFIGCGLCGVLTELKLQDWRFEQAVANFKKANSAEVVAESHIIKASPGFSPNPFPVLTIYWTGVLMSKHQQASELSTEIHTQWGNMFILGCAFRFITYLLMLLNPNMSGSLTRPSRPITELIVSFSLLCGGMIFMESTDPVILSFEYYGLTSMFTLNVSLGLVTLFMGWMMTLFSVKDWLKSKYKTGTQASP